MLAMGAGDVEDFKVLSSSQIGRTAESAEMVFPKSVAAFDEDAFAVVDGLVDGGYEFVLMGACGAVGEVLHYFWG